MERENKPIAGFSERMTLSEFEALLKSIDGFTVKPSERTEAFGEWEVTDGIMIAPCYVQAHSRASTVFVRVYPAKHDGWDANMVRDINMARDDLLDLEEWTSPDDYKDLDAKRAAQIIQSTVRSEMRQRKLRGGRPRNSNDDWACQQVWEQGREGNKVYGEWLNRIDPVRRGNLADPKDSFKKAVSKRRWKQLNEVNRGEERE